MPHESLNHYSKGAVISFLHRYVAGLRPERPTWTAVPGRADARRRDHRGPRPSTTPAGAASGVAWTMANGTFTLEVEVPARRRGRRRVAGWSVQGS